VQLMDDLFAYRRAFRSTEEGGHVVPMYHAKKVGEKKATMERASYSSRSHFTGPRLMRSADAREGEREKRRQKTSLLLARTAAYCVLCTVQYIGERGKEGERNTYRLAC